MRTFVQHELGGAKFVWDPAKAAANLRKHGVRFETAAEVFFDPFLRVVEAASPEETRDAVIGYTDSQSLLFVVHLILDEETIRIISARRATASERRLYEAD
jgi:uncharacterized DUF497 family protein